MSLEPPGHFRFILYILRFKKTKYRHGHYRPNQRLNLVTFVDLQGHFVTSSDLWSSMTGWKRVINDPE